MQTGSLGTLIGWKSGQTTFVPLWDRMEGAWLWTLYSIPVQELVTCVNFYVLDEFLKLAIVFLPLWEEWVKLLQNMISERTRQSLNTPPPHPSQPRREG